MASLLSSGCPPCPASFAPEFSPLCSPFSKHGGLSQCITSIASKDRFLASAFRKHEAKGLPPGAYEMIDDETREKVIVWGVDGIDMPPPPDEELRWKPVKFATPGDISDEALYRMLRSGEAADTASYSVGNGEGRPARFPEDDNSGSPEIKSSRLLSKKNKNSETGTLASKGLFSRLNMQSLRSQKKSGSQNVPEYDISKDKTVSKQKSPEASSSLEYNISKDKLVSKQKSLEASDSLFEAENDRNKRVSKVQKGAKAAKAMVSEDFLSIRTFKDVGAHERIIQSLNAMQIKRPSQIQAMSYEHVFKGGSCIIADQTGSGKTLAYLAPLVHRFLVDEEQGHNRSMPKSPRGLIMVPTSELAAQVLSVCRAFPKEGAPLKSMVATGGFRLKTQLEGLQDSPDILIATPGRFLQLLSSGSLLLENLISVILDEVDILFDDPEFSNALQRVESCASLRTQYIHVTATLPVDVCKALLEKHPDSIPLMGPGLHCTATGLQEVLVDCSGDGEKTPERAFENKRNALLQLVEQQPVSKTLVFCNKIETCRKVENALKRLDRKGSKLSVLPYHAALLQEVRLESMRQFMNSDSEKRLFLVCTDRASRGLDLVDVEHVVLFDFPRDPSEYVRRVGRTARAGGGGKAFVFVVGKQVTLARKIMVRNEKGHPIHTVPSYSY